MPSSMYLCHAWNRDGRNGYNLIHTRGTPIPVSRAHEPFGPGGGGEHGRGPRAQCLTFRRWGSKDSRIRPAPHGSKRGGEVPPPQMER